MKQFYSLLLLIGIAISGQSQTISEIQGEQADSPYNGSEVTTSGIVTAVAPDGFFIQDGTGGWSAIYVYNPGGTDPVMGDEVSVTGTVEEYFNMTEIGNVSNVEVLSSGNTVPDPMVVTTAEANEEQYESVLITVENATCTNPDIGFGEFQVDDGSGTLSVDDLMYLFSAQQDVSYTITGPLFYSFEAFKILPRDEDDILNASPLYFTVTPEEFDITMNSMTVQWSTNAEGNSVLEWGQTPDYELFTITNEDLVTEHSVDLTGLQPGRVYYIRAHSDDGENSTTLFERVVCTQSESSGAINVYFNHTVNTDVATVSEATYDPDIVSTIISYINQAEISLDITMYDTNGAPQSIFDAINAVYNNGVTVRLITDEELENVELDWLDENISVLATNFVGIMHDKFIVIDAEDTDNAWVMTGSMNWTNANLGWDFNNVICIQDESLAKSYTLEFEEIWGSNGPTPNQLVSAWGEFKNDNTPHKFIINDIPVEMYFSPSDGTPGQIEERILGSEDNIAFAIMAFTENSLGTALGTAHNNGVDVEGIIDYVEFTGSEFDYLEGLGIDVIDYQNADGSQWPDGPVLHHKYAIGDFMEGSDNPWVVTGSHNWTASAGSINDENTLIIFDHEIANWFYQEYTQRRLDQVGVEEIGEIEFDLWPNPANDQVSISLDQQGFWQILDNSGRLVRQGRVSMGQSVLDVKDLTAGTYVFRIISPEGSGSKVWVKK